MGAPSARVSGLSKCWAKDGHDVTVLTGFPNHPTGLIFPEYRDKIKKGVYVERKDGYRIVRTWLLTIPNGTPFQRILNYTSFFISATITGLRLNGFDIVIATSPQPLVGFAGYIVSLVKRKPFILEIRDLWPESLVGSGIGTEKSLLIRIIDRLANFLYLHSTHIVVLTESFRKNLISKRGIKEEKISIVENGIETDIFTPLEIKPEIKRDLGLGEKFIVSYIGTFGYAHGLDTVLEAAEILKDDEDINFLLIGEGVRKDYLIDLAKEKNLENVRFLDFQPRKMIPQFINLSDVCMVLLKDSEVFKTVVPSKMLEFMACGKPIILGVDGQAREVMEKGNAGIFIPPESSKKLAEAIIKLKDDPALKTRLGNNGREFVLSKFTREKKAKEYLNLLKNFI